MRVEEYDLCFSPPLPPTVWGELSLCFDVDFPIDTVSSIQAAAGVPVERICGHAEPGILDDHV